MTRASTPEHDLPPETIGGFRVLQTLTPSRSFIGVAENGRDVVIKVLDHACLIDGELHPDVRQRLARVRELAVPGVANLLSVERGGSRVYLIWEQIKGISLADWLAKHPDRNQRLLAARELVLIVESLHAAGIVHGAIHARNIFRDALGRLWLTHISPLLVVEVQDDVDHMNELLETMLSDIQFAPAGSLRQLRLSLAAMIDARDVTSPEEHSPDRESRRRRWMMLSAIGVAVLAAVLSYAIRTWTRPAASPPAATPDEVRGLSASPAALTFSSQRLPLSA